MNPTLAQEIERLESQTRKNQSESLPHKTHIETPNGLCAFLSHAPHNLSFSTGGTSKEEVLKNRTNLVSPFPLENLAYLSQIHSNKILIAQKGGLLGEGDGILITQKGIIGMVMVADCNPILLFDSKNQVVSLLHGGRVGLQKNILPCAIQLLKDKFHTNPQDIFVYVGPSIRTCCYEVQEEIFKDSVFLEFKKIRANKLYLDLVEMIKSQLKKEKITNITISPQCTKCNPEFFSYRRDSSCGRFGLFAYLQ